MGSSDKMVNVNRHYLDLFESGLQKIKCAAKAMDKLNDRFNEFVISFAQMMGMETVALNCVSYGNIRELEDLYTQNRR